ncbi:family 16 glycoside hydrolase [Bryobacter aggregatus]|uniref:family 16 glycoside hydrolase n=1 Tax=Bryobacter aggregatus TaxID=360054 RepID=UPI000691571E|nr:family 16 glycoside hydrolase [Bryobacter aggregatus]
MHRRNFFALPLALAAQSPEGKAGFAEADITPAIGSEMPGNYFKQFHKALHDPCKVRAAYFANNGKQVCLVGLDALMIPRHLVEKIRARVPGIEVMLGASHSHSSGPIGMVQPGEYDHASAAIQDLAYRQSSAADPAYLQLVENQTVRAIENAKRNAQPNSIGFGTGKEEAAIFNRRFRMKNGLTYTHPRPNNPDIVEAAGPIDGTLTVAGVFNDSKQLIGCIVNYSCHATTNPPAISANWIYFLERTIRGAFGDGVIVVFLQGFSGDVTQVNNLDKSPAPSGLESARLIGGRVGAEAVKLLLSMHPQPIPEISTAAKIYPEGRRIPGADRIAKAKATIAAPHTAESVFAKEVLLLDAQLQKQPSMPIELQAIAIGPAVYTSAPGEMFVALGLEIRKASPFPYTSPVSLANGCVGYVPTLDAFGEHGGGYEQRLTSYTNLVPDAGPRMVRESIELIRSLKPVLDTRNEAPVPFRAAWDYGAAPPDNTAITPKAPIQLFNGRDLTNFYTYTRESKHEDPNHVFVVANGELHISGQEWGGIVSKEAYRDYRLVVEWRWGDKTWTPRESKARDSGILIHGVGPDGGYSGIWLESYESQIIEGGSGDILVVTATTPMTATCLCTEDGKELYYDPKGKPVTRSKGRINWYGRSKQWKDEVNFRSKAEVEKPKGQWNRQEVIAAGDRMVCLLNGKVVSSAYDLSHTQGKLQVQSEMAEIYVRRIDLLPLKSADRQIAASISGH